MGGEGLEEAVEATAELLSRSTYAIVFTGSGISSEAGIPTFRGRDGLWNKYRPEELASPEAFKRDPLRVWRWYAWRLKLVLQARPTPAHRVIAALENRGLVRSVVTQNVDGLHQRAGSRNVIELHGSILRARCTGCGYKWMIDRVLEDSELPLRCPRCSSLARPDVVWFGEALPPDALRRAYSEFLKADLVLVVGTSGVVEPAGSLPLLAVENGAKLVNINLEPNRYSGIAHVNYMGSSSGFFKALAERLKISI